MADLLATQPVETAVAKALHLSYLAEALADPANDALGARLSAIPIWLFHALKTVFGMSLAYI
jgi:hypothetical protein